MTVRTTPIESTLTQVRYGRFRPHQADLAVAGAA
jgi:hypothetical protein